MSYFQRYPHLLEIAYRTVHRLIYPWRGRLHPGSAAERAFILLEKLSKGPLFACTMCGQCILHSSGMTCPMTCPKNLRNGPCGGVMPDGHCEVRPEMKCVWVLAWERSKSMPVFGQDILHIQAPLNNQLRGTSAWINDLHRKDEMAPQGWLG